MGTDKGVLTLWDLRFKIIVKSWHVKNNENNERLGSINNLELLSNSIKLFETKRMTVVVVVVVVVLILP